MAHGPPHGAASHGEVGVGAGVGGVGTIGTHLHSPVAVAVHSPRRIGPLQIWPGGHGIGALIVHGPPQVAASHGEVGVGAGVGGVGTIGTHLHSPVAVTVHSPRRIGMGGPLQILSFGHLIGTSTVHGPPHMAASHCGVRVGCGVCVGGGEPTTQPQLPAASSMH